MPIVLGLDLGTTTLTALALDTDTGEVVASLTVTNGGDITGTRRRVQGFSEWDVHSISGTACICLEQLVRKLSTRRKHLAGLAVTGQQHGVCLVANDSNRPRSPFINWQDQRGEQLFGEGQTFTSRARELLGVDAAHRTGCRLSTGYMAVTLFWLKQKGKLPARARACFLPDHFASYFTQSPVTDPTLAASSGIFDVQNGAWATDLIESLGLSPSLFPSVKPAGTLLGQFPPAKPRRPGWPTGLPVFNGLGDNQASFLGSVASPEDSVLVNVGTGGQVSVFLDEFQYDPALETRPFPGGFLLVCAGLTGGRVYAVLESFFRQVGCDLFGQSGEQSVYETMNRLAASVPPGCDGLRCEPFFSGTRQQPDLRGNWSGVSATNFTPAHMTRALLEGMARSFKEGFDRMTPHLARPRKQLIAAGNGMRENPLLRQIVGETFGLPVLVPRHREEAAYGAALTAAVGAGIFPDFRSAARLIGYELASRPERA